MLALKQLQEGDRFKVIRTQDVGVVKKESNQRWVKVQMSTTQRQHITELNEQIRVIKIRT